MITYAIIYHIWKLNVVGYHLASILLHILVALSVYWLISSLFKDNILACLTAIFFVVHPVHTGVVCYISSCADSLYLLFMLVSFIFYIKSSKNNGIICYAIMILSYLLALLSKENAIILPSLLLLYHYTFKEKIKPRELLSILGVSLIYILLRMTVLKYLTVGVISTSTLAQRIPGFFAAVATYIKLMLLPFNLHMEYGAPIFSLTNPRVICGLAILAGLIFCVFKTVKTDRLICFSLSWFLITLIPISNLYPINAYMAENWLYLPSIGFFLILAASLKTLYEKESSRIFAIAIAMCLAAFYSYLTIKQNETWREPIPFYERTLKYAPDSLKIYNNLGLAYAAVGRREEAVTMYKKAVELNPDYAHAYNNLGLAYAAAGRREDAIVMYRKAIEASPNYVLAYSNLGLAYAAAGRKEEAIAMFKKVIEINPNYTDAYSNLGVLYAALGRKEEAIAMYKKAIEINPGHCAAAYNNLANRYNETGRREEAIVMYEKAIDIDPNYTDAYSNLGVLYARIGRKEEATAAFKKALEIDPSHTGARHNLDNINSNSK